MNCQETMSETAGRGFGAATLFGAAAAYRAALDDGFTHATSIYCHPRAKVRLTKLLARAEKSETEYPHLAREKWEYNRERGYIRGSTDDHGLSRAPNAGDERPANNQKG